MAVETRFVTAFREGDTDEPGLILEDDGTVWVVAPGGDRSQLSGPGLPSEWVADEGGNVVITADPTNDTGLGVLHIDISEGPGQLAFSANGTIDIDLEGTNLNSPCIAATVSGNDGQGNVIFALAPSGTEAGNLPNIHLTDPDSPGQARFGYGMQSMIDSAFDPPAGQAVFRVRHGSPSYTGDIFHVRDGNGALVFSIRADGTVHIKTGGVVHADL